MTKCYHCGNEFDEDKAERATPNFPDDPETYVECPKCQRLVEI